MDNTQKKYDSTVETLKRGQEEAREMAKNTMAAGRETMDRVSALANENTRDFQGAVAAGFDGTKAISDRIMQNVMRNTQSALEAAQELSQAKSLPEAAQIYARLMQKNMSEYAKQTQELMELSQHTMQSALENYRTAATRSVERTQRTAADAQQAFHRQ